MPGRGKRLAERRHAIAATNMIFGFDQRNNPHRSPSLAGESLIGHDRSLSSKTPYRL